MKNISIIIAAAVIAVSAPAKASDDGLLLSMFEPGNAPELGLGSGVSAYPAVRTRLRQGDAFAKSDLRMNIRHAIADYIGADNVDIHINTDMSSLDDGGYRLEDISCNTRTGSFRVKLVSGDKSQIISGKYTEYASVPVALRPIARGEKISRSMLQTRQMPVHRLRSNSVMEAQDIIGKTATRSIKAGGVMRADDLASPVAVYEGMRVPVIYRSRYMELRANVEAMENGRVGDTVRVRNTESGKIFQAYIQRDGSLRVF